MRAGDFASFRGRRAVFARLLRGTMHRVDVLFFAGAVWVWREAAVGGGGVVGMYAGFLVVSIYSLHRFIRPRSTCLYIGCLQLQFVSHGIMHYYARVL